MSNNIVINKYSNHIQVYGHISEHLQIRANIMTDYDNITEFSMCVDGSDADDFCLECLEMEDLSKLSELFISIGKEINKFVNRELYDDNNLHG